LENLEEMDIFPDTYDQPKLNLKNINYLQISVGNNEIEAAIQSPKTEKTRI
jgi:hypothetical protein